MRSLWKYRGQHLSLTASVAIVVAALLVTALAACGVETSDAPGDQDSLAGEETSTPTVEPTDAPTTAPLPATTPDSTVPPRPTATPMPAPTASPVPVPTPTRVPAPTATAYPPFDSTPTPSGFGPTPTTVVGKQPNAPLTPTLASYTEVVAGADFSCGLKSDGTIACWGDLGWGITDPPQGEFQAIGAGFGFACGVSVNGAIDCWGSREFIGTDNPPGAFTSVSAGRAHACGVRPDGEGFCWGNNRQGETVVPQGSFLSIVTGSGHSCGLRADGSVVCWGYNHMGQTVAPDGAFASIDAGPSHNCGVRPNGSVECWGEGNRGETDAPQGSFTTVSAGFSHSCGVMTDSSVQCWGNNDLGKATPPQGSFTSVASGSDHTCALGSDGSITCWGSQGIAGAPEGDTSPTSTPVPTRTPRPTLGPQLSISDLPWAGGSMTGTEQQALASLRRIESYNSDVARMVLRFPWIADDITNDEQVALSHIAQLASRFSRSSGGIHEILGDTGWLIDDINFKETRYLELLASIQEPSTIIANLVANSYVHSLDDWTPPSPTPAPTPTTAPPSSASDFAWAQDGLTAIEREALEYLQTIESKFPDAFTQVATYQWLSQGIDEGGRRFLCNLSEVNDTGRAYAIALTSDSRQSPNPANWPACGSSSAGQAATPTPIPPGSILVFVGPQGAPPGDSIRVGGKGFPSNTTIERLWVYGKELVAPSSIQTDGNGEFSVNAVVPDVPPGQHVIRVTIAGNTYELTFQVYPG